MPIFRHLTRIDAPVDEVFAWHARPGALERLTPPWEPLRLLGHKGTVHDGDWVRIQIGILGWMARHRGFLPGRQFQDLQVRGPFAGWIHHHRFHPANGAANGGCELEDIIEYSLHGAKIAQSIAPWLGKAIDKGSEELIEGRLARMFGYRRFRLQRDLALHRHYATKPLRVLVSGASGLIGSQLVAFLSTGGHEVVRLVRHTAADPTEIRWDPAGGSLDPGALEGFDAVIHLAGESIAGHRWTPELKQRILSSRVQGTRLLAAAICRLKRPPRVLLSASAIGYYGDRGDHVLNEASDPGQGFLSEVCQQWEAEAQQVVSCGIRLVTPRIGIVLSAAGGALGAMLPAFRLGLGGILASGRQYMSWIGLDDLIAAMYHCIYTESLRGPVNFTAPDAVSNQDFTRTLGRVLHRPALFRVPATALELGLGEEMARELLLGGARVKPRRLLQSGFSYQDRELESALSQTLGLDPGPVH
ncbi:MAG: TIGR01777 family oxidoreductase [Candidatus Sericytochromatia bacterium]